MGDQTTRSGAHLGEPERAGTTTLVHERAHGHPCRELSFGRARVAGVHKQVLGAGQEIEGSRQGCRRCGSCGQTHVCAGQRAASPVDDPWTACGARPVACARPVCRPPPSTAASPVVHPAGAVVHSCPQVLGKSGAPHRPQRRPQVWLSTELFTTRGWRVLGALWTAEGDERVKGDPRLWTVLWTEPVLWTSGVSGTAA